MWKLMKRIRCLERGFLSEFRLCTVVSGEFESIAILNTVFITTGSHRVVSDT